jgi:hypothetical protein
MRYDFACSPSNRLCHFNGAIIVGIQQDQDPAAFRAFFCREQEDSVELIDTSDEFIPMNTDGWLNRGNSLRCEPTA